MTISSLPFLYLFLPLSILLYFLQRSNSAKNLMLLLLSLTFYAASSFHSLVFLLFIALLDYGTGKLLVRIKKEGIKSFVFISSVTLRVIIILSVKYILEFYHNTTIPVLSSVFLPLGFSFFMFKSISYLSEIYYEWTEPAEKFTDYLLFISMFPVAIAGPILRFSSIKEQLKERTVKSGNLADGILRISIGLIKKIVIADTMVTISSQFLVLNAEASWLSLLFGWFAFSLQIYYDFSGYSDIAIGIGLVLGFEFPENFTHPYTSRSVTEFWRKWHITLGAFFRDFVFTPISLSLSKFQVPISLFIVWILTGIWHGLTINFVAWGLYFFILLLSEVLFLGKLLKRIPALFQHIYLLSAVAIGFTFFYFKDFTEIISFYKMIFTAQQGSELNDALLKQNFYNHLPLLVIATIVCFPVKESWKEKALGIFNRFIGLKYAVRIALILIFLLISTSFLLTKSYKPFMYGGF